MIKIRSNFMQTIINRGESSDSIPVDLVLEILSRLPEKSIDRFRCVSKLWCSMLGRQYFTELSLTRSSARSRLLFYVERDGEWTLYSSPQPQNQSAKLSVVVAANFHPKFSSAYCSYVNGLIYYFCYRHNDAVHVICNPSTGQYETLPLPRSSSAGSSYSYLGFDPIDKQHKVLLMNTIRYIAHKKTVHHILTLGTGNMKWRNIQCPFTHEAFISRICINGVLYYFAMKIDVKSSKHGVVCFDVRSENFKFIDVECFRPGSDITLINYKGKLGGIHLKYAYDGGIFPLKLCMWVLDDVERQEWSKYVYTLEDVNNVIKVSKNLSVVGMNARGEIVLSMSFTSKPFYVFYFNPKRKNVHCAEIQGFGPNGEAFETDCRVHTFVNHVEDLNFNIMKTTSDATSISQPEESTPTSSRQDRRSTFESANKFNALCILFILIFLAACSVSFR